MRRLVALTLLYLLVLAGCGGGATAPSGAKLTIIPSSIPAISDNRQVAAFDNSTLQLVTVSIKAANGTVIGNKLDLWISISPISHQGANPGSAPVVQLYDGIQPVNAPLSVQTDTNGNYSFYVSFKTGGGLQYSGAIEARSGSSYASSSFSVTP